MIRIRRGKAPGDLGVIREEELRRCWARHRKGEPFEIGNRYNLESVRRALAKAQQLRCAYCEIATHEAGYPIDHFRPKGRAVRGTGSAPDKGYWWLAWTWENLLLVCPACNHAKRDQFPLDARGAKLRPGQQAPGRELAMLIDPGSEDPRDAIRFELLAGRWRPIPWRGSPRGLATIRALNLDSPKRFPHYLDHVRTQIGPLVKRVEAAIAAKDGPKATRAWAKLMKRAFRDLASYRSLSLDVIESRLSAQVRADYNLVLPPL